MSRPIIEVQGLAKSYRLGTIGVTSLREAASAWWSRMRQGNPGRDSKEFWALRDVTFSVSPGEVVGIIGRNGAGKSTLLKILSRITEPTSGRAILRGRVASLLEVGTGFHPDLSGRDNIYLNGAILGMPRAEIRRKFDEIVAFAGVEPFIDTPVKHYSSGMHTRLAFAVAAHLEPEILIIDEVLAVGDFRFQRKCIGKMGQVASQGRTVLVVSHDLDIVRMLCRNVVVLEAGRVAYQGAAEEGIQIYTGADRRPSQATVPLDTWADRDGSQEVRAVRISLFRPGQGPATTFAFGEPIGIEFELEVRANVLASFVLAIKTAEGFPVCDFISANSGLDWTKVGSGDRLRIIVPENRFYPRSYVGSLWIGDEASRRLDYVRDCVRFEVVERPDSGIERSLRRELGVVFQPSQWELVPASAVEK